MERTYEIPVVAFGIDREPPPARGAVRRDPDRPDAVVTSGRRAPATGWATIDVRDLTRHTVVDLVLELGARAVLVDDVGQRHLVRLTGVRDRRVERERDGSEVTVAMTVDWREVLPTDGE
jgi:hypothetical protein